MDSDILHNIFTEGSRRLFADQSPEETYEWALRQLGRLSAANQETKILDVPESVDFYNAVLDKRENFFDLPEDQRRELVFPWPSWNKMIDPLPGGVLMTLAGADGAGKTTYAECIAEWYAKAKFKVVYFHFELSHTIMMDRRMARWSGMPVHELKSRLSPEQKARKDKANGKILQWEGNIQYVHCPGWNMERVAQVIRNMHAEGKAEVVVIDYLEKASPSSRQLRLFGQNQYQREADNVELLKNTAESLEIPIVMVAQLNKDAKKNGNDDLDRTGIRGAGEKTEKANVVVLLKRERDEATGSYSPVVEVRLDKNTLGPTGAWRQVIGPTDTADGKHVAAFQVADVEFNRVELPKGGGR